jgi:tRNA (cmo5U34)-methyltransferase
MSKKLNIFNKSWAFNKNVSKSFDTHVRQSIPFYEVFQKDIAKYSEWFLKDDSLVYDLGCSTGKTIKYISKLNINTKFKIYAIDNSKPMIAIAKKNLSKIKKKNLQIKVIHGDIRKIIFKKCDLIYSILLMPFLSKKAQIDLLKKSYKSLKSGGAFISVNKIESNNSKFQDIFNQLYFDFKKKKKISSNDILKKSQALRSVMTLNTQTEEIKILKQVGFKKIEIFFKYLNFIGIIAVK